MQLCDDLRREVGAGNTAITTITGLTGAYAQIAEWIADADLQIQHRWADWNFLWTEFSAFTLTSGTREYSLSDLSITDMGSWDRDSFIINPTADDFNKLKELDYYEWRNSQKLGSGPQSAQDRPTRFVIKPDNAVVFYPTPNAATTYTFIADYWKTATRLSGDAATSNIPEKFERIILVRAKFMYWEFEEMQPPQQAIDEYAELTLQLESAELPDHHWSRQTRYDQDFVVMAS